MTLLCPSRRSLPLLFLVCLAAALTSGAAQPGRFTVFESGQVRPLALSPSGKLLFAANTPDGRLEVFRVKDPGGLEHRVSIPVGLEPVAVAARSENEVWVVNHLSDSISIVELTQGGHNGRVVRTLLVGDEPRDIVFGGTGKNRAFITTAHRGQNVPYDPQLTVPGTGRADVWVFDADHLGGTLTGTPLTIVTLFSDTPRALAVSPDGGRVYAAAFQSGNRTTAINDSFVPDGGQAAGGVPGPNTNANGNPAPEVGLIVRFNGTHWVDELGRPWDDQIRFSLPDKDVFVIDANANPPSQLAGTDGYYQGVGNFSDFTRTGTCTSCHVLDPNANREHGVAAPGLFGTDGRYAFEAAPEVFKPAHFRNAYQKVGMFGLKTKPSMPTDDAFLGDQIRGFGYTHNGTIPTIFNFMSLTTDFGGFNQSPAVPGGFVPGPAGVIQRRQVEDFLFAFDSNLAPIVGQQTTLTQDNGAVVGARIDLLIDRARAGECDLVVKGASNQGEKGYLSDVASGLFRGNRSDDAPFPDASLRQRALQKGGELTYTCAPPGSGARIGIDRDGDGVLDGDEEDAGKGVSSAWIPLRVRG